MGAPDQPQPGDGDEGIFGRVRSSPGLVIAIAAGVLLICAWIGWVIHVTSAHGASAGLGVVIAWPAMVVALALVSLPFIGLYLLIRRLSEGEAEDSEPESETEASKAG